MRRDAIFLFLIVLLGGWAVFPIVTRYRLQRQMAEAISRNQPDSPSRIAALSRRGADLQTRGHDGETVAMVAATWSDAGLLQDALRHGVNPNVQDNFGNTALFDAMSARNSGAARMLLEAGADVNHQTKSGDTALMAAVRSGQYETIPLLLKSGAKLSIRNAKGETAVTLAMALAPGGPRSMRPDLVAQDFVDVLTGKKPPVGDRK